MNAKKIAYDRGNWSQYARNYDALTSLLPYQQMLASVTRQIKVRPKLRILDAGCGTGNLLKILETSGICTELYGIDFSSEMLSHAKGKCGSGKIRFIQADLNKNLPCRDCSFDLVVSVNSIYAVSDPSLTIEELSRVTRPGGQLIIVTPKAGYDNGLVLKAHAKSMKPDTHWINPHSSPQRERRLINEAISDETVRKQMIAVAKHNREIASSTHFHFFDAAVLIAIVNGSGFRVEFCGLTYADQSLLVQAKK